MSKMFSFITKTWNPIAMKCPHGCLYCWAEALKKGKLKDAPRYKDLSAEPRLIEKELRRRFNEGDYVFVEDMGDLFAETVPDEYIAKILSVIKECPKAKFLLLTKNPERMLVWEKEIPENCLCGCTIETTRTVRSISKAPAPATRYMAMRNFHHPHKAVIIEPIMDFNLTQFLCWIEEIKPELVVVGYDNYSYGLPEPSIYKTTRFLERLKEIVPDVQVKTLREQRRI